jgi:MSHA biogenesis protein MshJ
LELTVSGTYLDLLDYLGELEKLPTQLYWSALELDATRYPKHTMKVTVYTLSLDPAWLSV